MHFTLYAIQEETLPDMTRQDHLFDDPNPERVGDCLEPVEAHAAVAGRLPALHLLLLQPEPAGQRRLRKSDHRPRADQRVGQIVERFQVDHAHIAAAQRLVLVELRAQLLNLARVLV